MWNGNNPMAYADPSGYIITGSGEDERPDPETQPRDDDGNQTGGSDDPAPQPEPAPRPADKTIATVVAHCGCPVKITHLQVAMMFFPATIEFETPLMIGTRGEVAVQAAEDIGSKVRINVDGRVRIPDGLNRTTLTEVKNVRYQSYTRQLKDFSAYSQANGLMFNLWVRPTTMLSTPLQNAVMDGLINLRTIP